MLCALTGSAQTSSKMSLLLRQQAADYQQAKQRAARRGMAAEETYVGAFVKLAPGAGTSLLEQYGGRVLTSSGEICIALLPASQLNAIAADEGVIRMEAQEPARPAMDTTDIITQASRIHPEGYSMEGLPQAYTGKGVVVGITDSGLDFCHPMLRDADGQSRVKETWDVLSGKGTGYMNIGSLIKAEEAIAQKGSRDSLSTHGSHVAGIAAGSSWQGYRGIAFESDIVAALMEYGGTEEQIKAMNADVARAAVPEITDLTSKNVTLNNVMDYMTIKYVLDYAKAHNQPCVVNCSWTGQRTFGPEAPLMEEFTSSLAGPGRIIVAGAGNDGDRKCYDEKKASEAVYRKSLWLADSTAFIAIQSDGPFTVSLSFDDFPLPEYTASFTSQEVELASQMESSRAYSVNIPTPDFKQPLFEATASKDGNSVLITLLAERPLCTNHQKMTLTIESAHDAKITTRWSRITFQEQDGSNEPYTVGDPAGFKDVIAVGATAYRKSVRSYSGKWLTAGAPTLNPMQRIVSWSGTGPTLSGLMKPDVVAPGYRIVSIYNSWIVKDCPANEEAVKDIVRTDKYDKDGQMYSVMAMDGTSMATPVVTGIIALWLQADPTLTPQRIKEVISKTAYPIDPAQKYPNNIYGYGQIDAYKGLLEILNLTGISELSKHQPKGISFRLEGDLLYADGAEEGTPVTIYDLKGAIVGKTTVKSGAVALGALAKGVYAVQMGQQGSTLIRK